MIPDVVPEQAFRKL